MFRLYIQNLIIEVWIVLQGQNALIIESESNG